MVSAARKIRIVTECSGLEPLPYVFDRLGLAGKYEMEAACEIDPLCRRVIRLCHTGPARPKKMLKDISRRQPWELPDHDLYVAGFPCQPFSTTGARQGVRDAKGRGLIITPPRWPPNAHGHSFWRTSKAWSRNTGQLSRTFCNSCARWRGPRTKWDSKYSARQTLASHSIESAFTSWACSGLPGFLESHSRGPPRGGVNRCPQRWAGGATPTDARRASGNNNFSCAQRPN